MSRVAPNNDWRQRTWIVLAAYNEASRLGAVLAEVCARYPQVVVVDDGSRDGTAEIARQYPVWLLQHAVNLGQGAALQTGITFALRCGAEIVVTCDADGQHQASDIERLVAPILEDRADVVLGSRFLGEAVNIPLLRRLVLRLGVWFTRWTTGLAVTDTHNGLRALHRRAALALRIRQNRMAHASEILHQIRQQGWRYCEVPVTIRYDAATLAKGQSTWNALRIVGELFLGWLVR
ncbi:MAG: glycosyltransferase family 2 protein [Gemmatales bacterium]|nr:glycosyltransferase family 2 protein [Gemmatales bacterium]MCS7160185.1 glycosyltransferase family 2 protein [Gemmatales bacterium]MDW8175385.1 glycosyltransferase family 2 protein [Gemmatales bacterium]MDW8221358.1 glycosyltransferase family 2 protein [Gemmatales bacterium]